MMEPTAHCSNEDEPSPYSSPATSSRFIIKQDTTEKSETYPKKQFDVNANSKTDGNIQNDEEILYIENLSSPETEPLNFQPSTNELGFIILSSGSENDEMKRKVHNFPQKSNFYDSSKENSEKNLELESKTRSYTLLQDKVCFGGETQFVQYYTAKEDKNHVRFVELFDEKKYNEEDDSEVPNKKRKICFGYDQYEPEDGGYRLKAEIEKLKIMQIIQECFLKLAEDGVLDSALGIKKRSKRMKGFTDQFKSFSCKRFVLPWIMIKIIEVILCNIMQFTFIIEGTYFSKIKEFLPLAVTFYLTLFLILATLLSYISCFTYSIIYNPFHMWSVIASAILTIMTTSGMFIMLCIAGYHASYLQVTVLFLSAALISCIIGELFLCYFELKRCMNQIGHADIL